MSLRDALRRSLQSGTTPTAVTDLAARRDGLTRSVAAVEQQLWLLAVGAMLMDVVLTIHGLHLGLAERNPIALVVLDSLGVVGLYALKLLALSVGAVTWWVVPDRFAPYVPLGLALPSLAAVVFNALLIAAVTTG
jgi:hypothetical protein